MVTLGVILIGFAAAANDGTSNGGTYCEPCNDETLNGIKWTSKNKANNYEENDVNTQRNAIYGVLVKMDCPSGFTGQATRICDGWGIWKSVQWTCESVDCSGPPKWDNPDAQVDNDATAASCKDYGGDKYCDVKCNSNLSPTRSQVMCFGGEWMTKDISCTNNNVVATTSAPSQQDGAVDSTRSTVAPGSQTSTEEGSPRTGSAGSALENNVEDNAFSVVPIVAIVGVVLVLLVGVGLIVYKSRSAKAARNMEHSSGMMTQSHGSSKHGSKHGSHNGRKKRSDGLE
eukprot:GEMP01026865.1.p1 GENE.GEMP01026865.1~~GEMP01026865.1.p1  ORF type:complete len:286 (+),score=39.06 GEMP01026865.1:527-1384(+)